MHTNLLPNTEPGYAGYTCWRAIVDNTDFNLNDSFETWGTNGRFGIAPLANHQLYWFACINAPRNSETMKQFKTSRFFFTMKQHNPYPEDYVCNFKKNMLLAYQILS